jgi:hypothetical protein
MFGPEVSALARKASERNFLTFEIKVSESRKRFCAEGWSYSPLTTLRTHIRP